MASGLSLEQLEQQLRQQDSQLDEQAQGVLKPPTGSRLPASQGTPPRRVNGSAVQSSPMSPSARARAEVTNSFSQRTSSSSTQSAAPRQDVRNHSGSSAQPIDESLPAETQLKLLRSRLRIVNAELGSVTQARDEWKARCSELDASVAASSAAAKQHQKQAATHNKRAESHKQALEKLQFSNKSLEGELTALRAELSSLRRSEKTADAGSAALQTRLQRALEERSALKEENAQLKANLRRGDESAELKQLRAANRDLVRQKAEVVSGFKAALKLVDVLKRQKVHMEAARLLAFSEDEFARSLESGAALLDSANK